MALRDHTTDAAKLSEALIEEIISGFVKYDPNRKSIHLLPKARELSVKKRILLYLAALRGWSFVLKEGIPAEDASPSEIAKGTGIGGGTIRPTLRTLSQSNILICRKGRYEIPAHNLIDVKDALNKSELPGEGTQTRPKKNKSKDSKAESKKNNRPLLGAAFKNLLERKWFKGGKTLGQLMKKLEEMAILAPVEQLPHHLLKACRTSPPQLLRKKQAMDGKNVWVYYQQ